MNDREVIEWSGYINGIEGDNIYAIIEQVGTKILEEAIFHFDDIKDEDFDRVVEGSVFKWIIVVDGDESYSEITFPDNSGDQETGTFGYLHDFVTRQLHILNKKVIDIGEQEIMEYFQENEIEYLEFITDGLEKLADNPELDEVIAFCVRTNRYGDKDMMVYRKDIADTVNKNCQKFLDLEEYEKCTRLKNIAKKLNIELKLEI